MTTDNKNYVYSMEKLAVNYSRELTRKELLAQNIRVVDSKGAAVDISVDFFQGNNRIVIISPPKDGYVAGEKYKLFMDSNVTFDIEGKFKDVKKLDFIAKSDYEIKFPDKNLEAAVRRQINKNNGSILKSEIYKLHSLNGENCSIIELTGIENFANLAILTLGGNSITNIDKIKELKNLEYLELNNNKIRDISPLKNLTKLKTLWLAGNEITDYSPTKAYFAKLTAKDFKIN